MQVFKLRYFALVLIFFTGILKADLELGAAQSLTRIYAIDGLNPPTKIRSNVGFGINLASDIKYNDSHFFIYGLSGKILHFNSPIEAKLTNNFTSINEYFLGLKKIKHETVYQFKIGTENFLYYQFKNNQYQIIRATPIMLNLKIENKLSSLKDLKYTIGVKSYLPFADVRDSGKVGFGGTVRLSFDTDENQAKFSPYLEAEYAVKKIKQTTFSRFSFSLGFDINIDIREKKSKLF